MVLAISASTGQTQRGVGMKGKTMSVYGGQTLGDIAEIVTKDPNVAGELFEQKKLVEQGKEAAAAEQRRHGEYVNAQYQAYIKTPEGAAWLANLNAKTVFKGHRKQTATQAIVNQMR